VSLKVTTGLLIALRRWFPRVSGYGSLAASGIFVITLSFLFTTPGALSAFSPANGFLLKDIMLFGAALSTGAEALRAEGKKYTMRKHRGLNGDKMEVS